MSEEFTRKLSELIGKIHYEKQGTYLLVLGEVDGVRVVYCYRDSSLGYRYVKVVLEEDLSSLSCREAEYSPRGLYVFSPDPRELAQKAYEKSLLITRRAKTT